MDHVHWFGTATQQLFSTLFGHEQAQDIGGLEHSLQHHAQFGFRVVQCRVQDHQDKDFKGSKHQVSPSQNVVIPLRRGGLLYTLASFQQQLLLSNWLAIDGNVVETQ